MTSNPSSRRNSLLQSPAGSAPSSRRNSVVQEMQALTMSHATKLALRPSLGSKGEKLTALTNHFSMDLSRLVDFLEYTVTMIRNPKSRAIVGGRVKRRVLELLLDTSPRMTRAASDYQTKLISLDELTPPGTEAFDYKVDYYTEEEQNPRAGDDKIFYVVTVRQSQKLAIEPFRKYLDGQNPGFDKVGEYTAAVNLLLSRFPNQTANVVTVARGTKYFDTSPQNGRVDLGFGLEAYKEYFRSARTSINGLVLNVNTSAAVFYKEGRLDLIIAEWQPERRPANNSERLDMLQKFLEHVRVKLQYATSRAKSIRIIPRLPNDRIADPNGDTYTFLRRQDPGVHQLQNQVRITVNQHFKETYPKAHRSNVKSIVVDIGTREQPCVVPSDLLYLLPGQTYKGYLPHSEQTTNMINFACRTPSANMGLILGEGLPQLGVHAAGGPRNRFPLLVVKNMITVNARSLPGPQVRFKAPREDKVAGSGEWSLRDRKFPKANTALMKYTHLQLLPKGVPQVTNLDAFLKEISQGIRTYCGFPGAQTLTFEDVPETLDYPSNHLKRYFDLVKAKGIKVVFVILPNYLAQNYHDVKTIADTVCGIHTICTVRKGKTVKASVGEVANLLLKFNLKLGGQNIQMNPSSHKVILGKRTMFVGADVSHPSKGSMEDSPSIAGVVATNDNEYSQYLGSTRLQRHHNEKKQALEMIANFDDMMAERLQFYQESNKGALPDQIIIYRDGVSDGQYPLVVAEEYPLIVRGCKRVYGLLPLPKILLIVVQKRHHVRFYKPDNKPSKHWDHNGNPLPGFVVDGQITSERSWDWYCTSHKCLQGTSRPAKYIILRDGIGVLPDDIQLLTHHMCWLFGRATKSISVHPAARYADLRCERTRVHMRLVYSPGPSQPVPIYDPAAHSQGVVAEDLRNTMFYV